MQLQVSEENIGKIVQFNHHSHSFLALIFRITSDGRYCCYRVSEKIKDFAYSIKYHTDNGKRYTIHYGCRFYLPGNRFTNSVAVCPKEIIMECNDLFMELPTYEELIGEYNRLKREITILPAKEAKMKVHRLNSLATLTNDLQANFLKERESKASGKYSNFRFVPNQKGITSIVSGGGCSKK